MTKFWLTFVLFVGLSAWYVEAQRLPACKNKTVVIAHRGDHTTAPENTIQSIRDAIAAGVDYAEVDLRSSKDGVLVIMHDARVDRTTNGTGSVRDKMFSELRTLQVVDKHHPEFGIHQIPTFQEILQEAKGKINLYLDFKDADVAQAWKEIITAGMQRSVVVYINAEQQFTTWRQVAPTMPLMISLPDSVTSEQQLAAFLKKTDAEVLDGDYTQYSPGMIALAKKHRRAIWVDVQKPDENPMYWDTIDRHFDGLQTDHPRQLTEYLTKAGRR